MSDPLNDFFKSLNSLHTEQRELAAIWLSEAIVTGSGRTVRIAPGETVRVNAGKLDDITDDAPATHKVIGCIGTLYSKFEFTLLDLDTNEPLQLKL